MSQNKSNWWIGPMDPTKQWYKLPELIKSNVPGPVWATHPDLLRQKELNDITDYNTISLPSNGNDSR